jgi:phosphatidylserine decarboxylase
MIAREGFPFIFSGLALTILLILGASRWDSRWLFAASITFGVLTLFTTFFFRDPNRSFEPATGVLISPADGTILRVDTLESHSFIDGKVTKVSIFLSVMNVHVNRVPASGKIDFVKYNPGKFFAAWADKASELNEQTEIGMTTESGQKIIFKQIAGLIARRIVCRLMPQEDVAAGERFGMIRFGSRTELFVPADSKIAVKPGDKVKGGKTVIGYLPAVSSSQAPSAQTAKVNREQL